MRNYQCLQENIFYSNEYKLIPIRDQDKYEIMDWRNNQIAILRQKNLLTTTQQELYFEKVVNQLFTQKQPTQLLFSFLRKNTLIGYGGLVHIDWRNKNAEISFLLKTEKSISNSYHTLFTIFLEMIEYVAKEIALRKIFTYGYDTDSSRFLPLIDSLFECEVILKDHIQVSDRVHNVRIYSKFITTTTS